MNNNLLFDFNVDKAAKTVYIHGSLMPGFFSVDAFTKPELLDQWGAPAPMRDKPDGQERWAVQEFISITPKTNSKMYNAFADKDENRELPGSEWDYN